MATKNIIAAGVGFTGGEGTKWIVTRGFSIGEGGTTVVPRVIVARKFAKPAIKVVKVGK